MLAASLPLAARQQSRETPPQFNVRVNLVSLDVEVLDRRGNPVPGLAAGDFLLKENGKPVEIAHFSRVNDGPVSLAIVLDTSAISSDRLVAAKHFIIELIHVLDRSDELCLVSFDSRDAYLEQAFTPSRGLIVEALENIGVPSSGSGGILRELFGRQPPTGLGIDTGLRRLRGTTRGKNALLLVSNRFRGLGPATVEHVQRSGCTLLTLEFDNKAAVMVTLGGDRISTNQLMKESGGRRYSADTDDVGGVCRNIAWSLKNYYVLGYLAETGLDKGKPPRLQVSVPGKDYILHYRRSYTPQELPK